MPNEILTEICSHAHDGDDTESRGKEWLRAVRLTCKQLHIPATVEFGKRFLGSVPVMAARVSLETLFDICQHPLIGPQVSNIQLFSRRPYEDHVKSLGRDLWTYTSDGDLAGLQKTRRLLESYLNLIEDGLALEEYLEPFNYLRCALTMIRIFGKPVTLSVSTHGYVRPLEYLTALGSLLDDSEDTLVDFVDQNCVRPSLGVLLVAAAESGCLVDKIELEIDDSEHEYDVSCWSWNQRRGSFQGQSLSCEHDSSHVRRAAP